MFAMFTHPKAELININTVLQEFHYAVGFGYSPTEDSPYLFSHIVVGVIGDTVSVYAGNGVNVWTYDRLVKVEGTTDPRRGVEEFINRFNTEDETNA